MDLSNEIKNFVYNTWGSNNIDRFPGPQPVSIERRHFGIIKSKEYMVCEKTDGIRHILTCFSVGQTKTKICALVNRSFEYALHSFTIPRETLLDGELIGDVFLVHDAIMIAGKNLINETLSVRLSHVRGLCKSIIPGRIKVLCKNMVPISRIESVILNSKSDGLIFTPVDEPVRMGTHRTMFKWKEKHTVDFIVSDGFLCVQHESKLQRIQRTSETEDGKILECVHTSDGWVPIIVRKDKTHPNNLRTFERTKVNIEENVTFNELVRTFGSGN
jgi:hypothetical protein